MKKFCKDCKWFQPRYWKPHWWSTQELNSADCRCTHDKAYVVPRFDLISGEERKPSFCQTQREVDNRCGASASWFEAKTEPVS